MNRHVPTCKADVEQRRDRPAVNVKVYRDMTSGIIAETGDDGFTWKWVDANMTDDELSDWWHIACESGWEDLQSDAEDIFGPRVKVWSDGRQGGWAVVDGLSDVDDWDAVMLGKWQKWCRWARATADAQPEVMADLIYLNVYDAAMVDADEDRELAAIEGVSA